MNQTTKQISRLVTLVVGLLIAVEFFLKIPVLNKTVATILGWMPLISAFAVVAGGLNLVAVHRDNIAKQKPGWYNSVIMLGFMALTIVVGVAQGTTSPTYSFLYYQILIVCGNSLSGLLAFFIASSSFRAFRAKNVEAALLLIAGAIVMLGQAPFGAVLWASFPSIGSWIIQYPNLAAQRGLMIAAGVGFMSVSLRTILGYSRSRGVAE